MMIIMFAKHDVYHVSCQAQFGGGDESQWEQVAENREKILLPPENCSASAASSRLPSQKFMKAAGLTHGGFYGYLDSKEELIAAALADALARTTPRSTAYPPMPPSICRPNSGMIARNGWTAALAAETIRQAPEARAVLTSAIRSQIARLSEKSPAKSPAKRRGRRLPPGPLWSAPWCWPASATTANYPTSFWPRRGSGSGKPAKKLRVCQIRWRSEAARARRAGGHRRTMRASRRFVAAVADRGSRAQRAGDNSGAALGAFPRMKQNAVRLSEPLRPSICPALEQILYARTPNIARAECRPMCLKPKKGW